jgi:endoglucanase
MKRTCCTLMICLLFSASSLFSASPVDTHGALKVSGNQIVGSKDNQPVQVAGMSLYWSVWGGERYYNADLVNWLVDDWNITLIRCAMAVEPRSTNGQQGYLADPEGQKSLLKKVIDAAIARGIYVIVDWHDHNANANVNQAKTFFAEMAQTYSSTPNIIWEIWNEPDNTGGSGDKGADTWNDIKSYANQVIPVIREHSSNLIIVGTPFWAQNVDEAADDPLSGTNIAYTLHFYAGSHGEKLRAKADAALGKGAALFITEFGLSIADGGNTDKTVYTNEGKAWLDWADQKGISWANWSIMDKDESSAALVPGAPAAGNWNSGNISQSGQWIRERLKSRKVYDFDPIPEDTLKLPGRVEAEKFSSKSEGLQTETTSDAGGGENLGYTTPGSWAEYEIFVSRGGTYTASLRVATESEGGTVTLKINGASVGSWNVGNTGGWQEWTTTSVSSEFSLQSGPAALRVEWSGSGSSLVNLNWIEFQVVTSVVNHAGSLAGNRIRLLGKQPGSIVVELSADAEKVSLFSLSGSLLKSFKARPGKVKLPLGKGVHLLRIENRSGEYISVPVIGY